MKDAAPVATKVPIQITFRRATNCLSIFRRVSQMVRQRPKRSFRFLKLVPD